MATLSEVNSKLVTLIKNALTGANITAVKVGSEWPSDDVLEDAGNGIAPSVIAVIHKMSTFPTQNLSFQHSYTTYQVGIQSHVSDFSIAPSQSVSLTISLAEGSLAVKKDDMVSCILSNGDSNEAATYIAPSGSATLNTMAAGLAAAIQTKFSGFSATASGSVITITNGQAVGYHIASSVGNRTDVSKAVKWAIRSMQINVWCGDLETKKNIRNAMEILLGQLDDSDGFILPSNEWVRLKFNGAKPNDADTDKDVYCDFYLFTIEHFVDIPIEKWAVVATDPDLS